MSLLADAGPLDAFVDADDRRDNESLELLLRYTDSLLLPMR